MQIPHLASLKSPSAASVVLFREQFKTAIGPGTPTPSQVHLIAHPAPSAAQPHTCVPPSEPVLSHFAAGLPPYHQKAFSHITPPSSRGQLSTIPESPLITLRVQLNLSIVSSKVPCPSPPSPSLYFCFCDFWLSTGTLLH